MSELKNLVKPPKSAERIDMMPISGLSPYPQNARTHSRKQIRQIAESIRRFGFTNPVLIDDANQIMAGHGRVEAAKLIGLAEVPTVRLSHLSTAEMLASFSEAQLPQLTQRASFECC